MRTFAPILSLLSVTMLLILYSCSTATQNTVTLPNPTHGNSTITIASDTANGTINVTVNDITPNTVVYSVELWVNGYLVAVNTPDIPSANYSTSFTFDTYVNYLMHGSNTVYATVQFGGSGFAPDLRSTSITVNY